MFTKIANSLCKVIGHRWRYKDYSNWMNEIGNEFPFKILNHNKKHSSVNNYPSRATFDEDIKKIFTEGGVGTYSNVNIPGFPISKSRKPKSVVLNELTLNTLLPIPGIAG